jgi:hypothetical protein
MNQEHLALVARHRGGIGKLMARSRIEPSKVLVIIAHVESPVGRSFVEAGVAPASGRSSLVVPTNIEAASMFADALADPEVKDGVERHLATAVLVFDRAGSVGVTFERFVPTTTLEVRARDAP